MSEHARILLAHGGGGQLTAELIERVILPALGESPAAGLTDAAILSATGDRLAFTTDSYVIWPLEFPGGDIGKLAICGTVNDLAVSGAQPIALSLGLVLEEGLEVALLRRVLTSAGLAARAAGVAVVTGDTKVVEHGKCDGLYANTSGLGAVLPQADLGFHRIQPGDAVLLSGPLGQHGLAIMSQRKGLSFTSSLTSDCAALDGPCMALVRGTGLRGSVHAGPHARRPGGRSGRRQPRGQSRYRNRTGGHPRRSGGPRGGGDAGAGLAVRRQRGQVHGRRRARRRRTAR